MKQSKKYLSRNEAAELLEVSTQSISNYAERGFLTIVRSRTNGFFKFKREEVENLKPHVVEIQKREHLINEYKMALNEDLNKLAQSWQEQRMLLDRSNLCVSYTKQLIEDCCSLVETTNDSIAVRTLIRVIKGELPGEIAKDLGTTYYQVNRFCKSALQSLHKLPNYEEIYKQNSVLKSQLSGLRVSYVLLTERYETLSQMFQKLDESNREP